MWCVRRIGGQIFAKQGPVLRVGLLALSLEAGFLQAAHLADFGNGRVRFGLYSELYSAGNKFQLQAGAYVQPCPAHPEATQFYAGDGDVIVFAIAAGVVQGLDADAGGLAGSREACVWEVRNKGCQAGNCAWWTSNKRLPRRMARESGG